MQLFLLLFSLHLALPSSTARIPPLDPPGVSEMLGLTCGNSSDAFQYPSLPAGSIAYSSDPLLSSLPSTDDPFHFPLCPTCGLATSTSSLTAPPPTPAPSPQYAFLQLSPSTHSANLTSLIYGLLPSLNYTLAFHYAVIAPSSLAPFNATLSVTANSANDPSSTVVYRTTLTTATPWTVVHPLDHFWPNPSTAGLACLSFHLSLPPSSPSSSPSLSSSLTLLLSSVRVLQFPLPTPLLDLLVLGDAASEAAHRFQAPASIVGVVDPSSLPLSYPAPLPYRQPTTSSTSRSSLPPLLPPSLLGFLNVTLTVHPSSPTHLTLKLYGSDAQRGVLHLFVAAPQGSNETAGPEWVDVGRGLWQLGQWGSAAGANGAVVAPLNAVVGGRVGSRPRRFCFATTALPLAITADAPPSLC